MRMSLYMSCFFCLFFIVALFFVLSLPSNPFLFLFSSERHAADVWAVAAAHQSEQKDRKLSSNSVPWRQAGHHNSRLHRKLSKWLITPRTTDGPPSRVLFLLWMFFFFITLKCWCFLLKNCIDQHSEYFFWPSWSEYFVIMYIWSGEDVTRCVLERLLYIGA